MNMNPLLSMPIPRGTQDDQMAKAGVGLRPPGMTANATNPAPAPARQGSPLQMPTVTPGAMQVQPKADNPNPLAGAFASFARGFAPQQTQAVDERHKADAATRLTKTLTWMQQTAALPAEQRAAFQLQRAQDIARDTGQPYESVLATARDPNAFSDQAIQQGIAALSAQLGIAPEKPAGPLTINNKLVDPRTGQVLGDYSDPQKPMAVNNRLVDPQTGQVIGDYSDPAKPQQSDYVQAQLADGIYFVNKNNPNDKIRLGAAPPKDGSGPVDPNAPPDPERIRLEREYAKSWDGVRNNFSEIKGQFDRINAMGNLAATDPKSRSAADLALIVSFTKMLDPGSVAREGEVKLTQSAASLVDMVRNLPNQWVNGQTTIPDETRQALLRAANEMMPSYQAAYERLASDIGATADSYGFPRSRVMMGYRPPEPPAPQGAGLFGAGAGLLASQGARPQQAASAPQQQSTVQPGTIDVDDDTGEQYRFKGGDPTDPRNWEPVR